MWIRGEFHAHRASFGKVIVLASNGYTDISMGGD